jgi:hypothetical protein
MLLTTWQVILGLGRSDVATLRLLLLLLLLLVVLK